MRKIIININLIIITKTKNLLHLQKVLFQKNKKTLQTIAVDIFIMVGVRGLEPRTH